MYDGDPDKRKYYELATKLFYEYYADYFEGEHPRIERYEVPYENGRLPVMHVKPEGERKGLILIHGGNDSYFEEFLFTILYLQEKGFEVYMFEGPGQGGVMRLQGIHYTHEWEKPVKAILDYFDLRDVTIVGISSAVIWHRERLLLTNALRRLLHGLFSRVFRISLSGRSSPPYRKRFACL